MTFRLHEATSKRDKVVLLANLLPGKYVVTPGIMPGEDDLWIGPFDSERDLEIYMQNSWEFFSDGDRIVTIEGVPYVYHADATPAVDDDEDVSPTDTEIDHWRKCMFVTRLRNLGHDHHPNRGPSPEDMLDRDCTQDCRFGGHFKY